METRCYGCMNVKQQRPVCEHCGFPEGTPNALHQLPLGTVLREQYVIGRALGQGGFGITYLAWDRELETPVAIKEYYPSGQVSRNGILSTAITCNTEAGQFQEGCERFVKEARTLAKLQNLGNIVKISGFFRANNTAYIVMEYVQGITLLEYMKQRGGRLTASETFAILRPVMKALHKVHEAGMIHRDISPDNIMLQNDGTVKLLDFGTARDLDSTGGQLTHSTQAVLKYGFAPIEQYSAGKAIDRRADEYALCASIFYCLTGQLPPDALQRLVDGLPMDWRSIPGLTTGQIAALEAGSAIKAENRFPDLKSLEEALFGEASKTVDRKEKTPIRPEKEPLRENSETEPVLQNRKPKKKKGLLGLGIAALATAGALALVLLGGGEKEPPQPSVAQAPSSSTGVQPAAAAPELTLWAYPIGGWGKQEQLDPLMAAFQEDTGIRIHVEYLNYADGDDKLQAAIAGGMAPDLVLGDPERARTQWAPTGTLVNLSDLFDSRDREQIYPAVYDACFDASGDAYLYPMTMTVHTMAINRTIFEAAGAMQYIDENTRTWTTENFQKAVAAVYKYTKQNVGIVCCGGRGGDQATRALVTNLAGGSFVSPDLRSYTWDSEENISALKMLKGMKGITFDKTCAGGDEIALFYNGTLNMAFCWNIAQQLNPNMANTDAERTMNGHDIFVMAFPSPKGRDVRLQGGIWGFSVFDNGDAARIEGAKQFIEYFCKSPAAADAVRLANYFPVRQQAGDTDLTNVWQDNPIMQEYQQLMPYLGDYYTGLAPNWLEARDQWCSMLQAVASASEKNMAKVVQKAAENANAGIS